MPIAETIGLIASCVQIAELATKSIKNLHSLQLKFKNAAHTFELLSSQLLAVKSAVKHISLWLDQSSSESIWSHELRGDLVQSLEACAALLQKISEQSFRLDQDSRTALLLERVKYVWKADEFRGYQELLRDHVQALSFLLQVAQLPTHSEQDTLLRRSDSRRIIDKPRDDSSSLLWLRDDQSAGSPLEPAYDDLKRFSVSFAFDNEVLNSRAYHSTLASFMKQKLHDNGKASQRVDSINVDSGSATLHDVLSEIDQELEAITGVDPEHLSDALSPTAYQTQQIDGLSVQSDLIDLRSIENQPTTEISDSSTQNDLAGLRIDDEPLLEKPLEYSPRSSLDGQSDEKTDVVSAEVASKSNTSVSTEHKIYTFDSKSGISLTENEEQRYDEERINVVDKELGSVGVLRKAQSTPQVLDASTIHRSNARKVVRRAFSEDHEGPTQQQSRIPIALRKKEDPIDELVALFDDRERGKAPDVHKIENLAFKLGARPNFIRKMTPPYFHHSHGTQNRLNRGHIAGRFASHGGPQSELEAHNRQATRLGYPTVGPEEFEEFQRAWNFVDPSRNRYIPKDRLPKLISSLEGPFGMSIYESEFTISKLSSHLDLDYNSSNSRSSAELADTVTSRLRHLPISWIRARRKRLNFFFQEALFCADTVLGLNFSEVLKTVTFYRDVMYFANWREANSVDIERAIEAEDGVLLERFVKRRARLERVEEVASIERLRGWTETVYWRRRFKSYQSAKRNLEEKFTCTQAIDSDKAVSKEVF